jgi:hypothetical protein
VQARCGQRLVERGAIGAFAGFDLGKLAGDLPVTTIEIGFDGLALGIDAKAGLALFASGNPVIADTCRCWGS